MGILSFIEKKIEKKILDYVFSPCGYDPYSIEFEYLKTLVKGWSKRTVESKTYDIKTEYWINGLSSKIFKNISTHDIKNFRIDHDRKNGIDILFCFHGNGETSINSLHYLKPLTKELLNDYLIVLVEYPFYGGNITENKKRPTENECYEMSYRVYIDVLKLLHKQNLSIKSINLFGRSIGTGIAVWMSTVCNYVNKLVLIHPFMSIAEVPLQIQRKWNTPNTMNVILNKYNLFDNFTTIEETNAKKILIVHAENDPLIHINHSKQLYKKLNFILKIPTYFIILPNGGHDCDFLLPKEFFNNEDRIIKSTNSISNPHDKEEINYTFATLLTPSKDKKICGDIIGIPSLSVSVFNDVKNFLL